MAQFFVSLLGGAYCLVEHPSLGGLIDEVAHGDPATKRGGFRLLTRPDGKTVAVKPQDITLIQPPAPASFKHTDTKEN